MNAARTDLGKPRDRFLITTTPSSCPRHHPLHAEGSHEGKH
jgi:hypothetical protein